jgi:cell cycle serine/threonine-protein kinase CDC5/MSD2
MAPELLINKDTAYNSKADLWSIGVVFYQLLFGKTPFDAKNYNDLKNKVKTLSGEKLTFPGNIPISDQCKKLLTSLIQFNV